MNSTRQLGVLGLFCATCLATSAALVDDTFADGNSRNQNLAQNSLNFFDGRTGPNGTSSASYSRTDAAGSVTFGMTASGTSSQAFWAYFTGNQTSPGTAWSNTTPVSLNVGDTLTVSTTFGFTGLVGTGQDVRFGLINSMGTRNTNNLTGGQNDATFADDLGYSLDFFPSGTGSPFVIGKRNLTTAASLGTSGLNNMFNSLTEFDTIAGSGSTVRQTLTSGTSYTLTYSAFRQSDTNTVITATVTGGSLSQPYTWTATDTSAPVTSFDYFVYRIAGVSFATAVSFTELKAQYTPALPVITAQPTFSTGTTNQTVGIGGQVIMAVSATGTGVTYQWRKDGTPLTDGTQADGSLVSGATGATMTFSNLQLTDTGSYTVAVSNAGGSVISDPLSLTVTNAVVDPPPVITSQPVSQMVNFGSTATLSVGATGNALAYQWYKNGVAIGGATNSSLVLTAVQPGDTGVYRVNVSNDGGTVPSSNATLTVLSTTLTLNSLFPANNSAAICPDTQVSITFAGPPTFGSVGTIKIFDASTNVAVDTIDVSTPSQVKTIGTLSSFNYYPVIITGNTAAIYFRNNVLGYNKTYYITVDPGVFQDAQGVFGGISDPTAWRFTTKSSAPTAGATLLTVAADGTGDFATVQGAIDFVPAGNTTPRTIFIRKGTYPEIVYFTGKHSLTFLGEDRFQTVIQYANNNNFNNASGTYHRMVFQADHANNVVVANLTIKNTTPLGGSQAEALLLNGTNTSQAIVTGVELVSFQDTLQINGQGYISDSHISGNTDFMWGNGPNFFFNCELTANSQGGYYTQIRNPITTTNHGNVYLNCTLDFLPGVSGLYLGRIDPTVFPYSEVVYLNCVMGSQILPAGWLLNNATTAPNVHFWEYNSHDANNNPVNVSQRIASSAQLTQANDATTIANYSTPSYVLGNSWTPQLAPIIVAQPTAQTINLGGALTLSVGVVAVPEPTYQWMRNGVAIPGATGATYTVANAGAGDAGTYSVLISNGTTSVTSSTIPVVVNGGPPVILLPPQNQSGLAGATVSFSVYALGQGPLTYQWSKSGVPIGGATQRSLMLTGLQAADAASYSVAVSNGGGSAVSSSATLTIVPPAGTTPTLPNIPATVFDVTTYGAVGDGATDNTTAIQNAINAAQAAGGGTIELPPAGGSYLSGPLTLFSNMNLQVDGGATLQALPFGTYPGSLTSPAHFITVNSGSTNVEISGSGTIDGNGAAWWAAFNNNTITSRPRLIQVNHASNVLITNVALQNPAQFHIATNTTNNVTIFGITINTDPNSPNTDGIDPAGSNYLIQNCSIATGDDNIAVKPGGVANSNIQIANCSFGAGHGLSIGGQTNAGLNGMTVNNCTFTGTTAGLRMKADPTEGGLVQNVTYSNLTMTNVQSPIVFYSYYNLVGSPGAVSGSNQTTPAKVNSWNTTPPNSLATSTLPGWQNIAINNLTATGATGYSIIWGLPLANGLIANVTLNNVNISGGPGLEVYDATNVQFLGTSNVGALTTCNALAITGQPQASNANVGDSVNFTVTVAGASGINNTPPTVQWNLNGVPLGNGVRADGSVVSGATTGTLNIANVRVTEAGSYTATVANLLDGYNVAASTLNPNSLSVSATSQGATLTVQPVPASVALSNLNAVYDGTPKIPTVVTSPANLAVQVTYNGSASPPVNAGSYSVVATITDPNYSGSASGTLTIAKATPTITWNTPAAINYGTPLGAGQLNAIADVPGTFVYTPAAGTVLGVGVNQPLSVAFTPTDTVDYNNASGSTTITVNKAVAVVTLGSLTQTYDGTPKSVIVTTVPAGLGVSVTYDGSTTPPVNAGSYSVVATVNDANYIGSASGTLTIKPAPATITLGNLRQLYDGTPKSVTATTTPAGLKVDITYDGSPTPPTNPGSYAVVATIDEPNYTGSVGDTLVITITALVRHGPTMSGGLDGSVQVLSGENMILNSGAWISGDLLVPGIPAIQVHGQATYGGVRDSGGSPTPAGYKITLNGDAILRYIVQRTDPINLPAVNAPPLPSGTRDVTLNAANQSVGDFSTIRNLTLNNGAGLITVPAGTYGAFKANNNCGFVLGVAGATQPAIYNFQSLAFNGSSQFRIAGPVIVTLANGMTIGGGMDPSADPNWLTLDIYSGGLTLNSDVSFNGYVLAPAGTVMLNNTATLQGGVNCDSLTISHGALLTDPKP